MTVGLLLLLAATLFHALRLERALGVLKRDRAVLEELVQGFNDSTRQAETGIERLRGAADGAGRQISRQIEAAQLLRDDLNFLTDRSDRLAERLETAVRSARMLVDTAACSPHPTIVRPAAVPAPQLVTSAMPEQATRPAMAQLSAVRTTSVEDEAEPLPRLRSQAERDLLRALRAGQ